VTPQEVIAAILKAEVDLLWFGGIGTYVRGEQAKPTREAGDAPTTRSASPAATCAPR
jgi:glutamate dehydrogenase